LTDTKRLSLVFTLSLIACNVIGIATYLLMASHAWAIPQERALGLNSTTGEPFIWATAVFPIYAVFLLLNSVWGVRLLRRQDWISGRFWLATFGFWIAAVTVDFAHH
jgi:hypothetical protein